MPSTIRSSIRAVFTRTSVFSAIPPFVPGISRCEQTPTSVPASICRASGPRCSPKKSTNRWTVSAASMVCMVQSTRWPVSAARSAVIAVSSSRTSPIMITSGSWRIAARRATW